MSTTAPLGLQRLLDEAEPRGGGDEETYWFAGCPNCSETMVIRLIDCGVGVACTLCGKGKAYFESVCAAFDIPAHEMFYDVEPTNRPDLPMFWTLVEIGASPGVTVRRVLTHATGEFVSAAVLSQLLWRLTKAKNPKRIQIHDGRRWLILSAADLADDIGMTAKQARGALERLDDKGLINRRLVRHHGTNIHAIALCEEKIEAALSEVASRPVKQNHWDPEDDDGEPF